MAYELKKTGDLNSGKWEWAIYDGRKQIAILNMAINPFNNGGIGPEQYGTMIINTLNGLNDVAERFQSGKRDGATMGQISNIIDAAKGI